MPKCSFCNIKLTKFNHGVAVETDSENTVYSRIIVVCLKCKEKQRQKTKSKTFKISWSNEWVISAKDKDAALLTVVDLMHEAVFDEDQFTINER